MKFLLFFKMSNNFHKFDTKLQYNMEAKRKLIIIEIDDFCTDADGSPMLLENCATSPTERNIIQTKEIRWRNLKS